MLTPLNAISAPIKLVHPSSFIGVTFSKPAPKKYITHTVPDTFKKADALPEGDFSQFVPIAKSIYMKMKDQFSKVLSGHIQHSKPSKTAVSHDQIFEQFNNIIANDSGGMRSITHRSINDLFITMNQRYSPQMRHSIIQQQMPNDYLAAYILKESDIAAKLDQIDPKLTEKFRKYTALYIQRNAKQISFGYPYCEMNYGTFDKNFHRGGMKAFNGKSIKALNTVLNFLKPAVWVNLAKEVKGVPVSKLETKPKMIRFNIPHKGCSKKTMDLKIAQFLHIMEYCKKNNLPALITCTHGMDRTGMFAAIWKIYSKQMPLEDALLERFAFGGGHDAFHTRIVEFAKEIQPDGSWKHMDRFKKHLPDMDKIMAGKPAQV